MFIEDRRRCRVSGLNPSRTSQIAEERGIQVGSPPPQQLENPVPLAPLSGLININQSSLRLRVLFFEAVCAGSVIKYESSESPLILLFFSSVRAPHGASVASRTASASGESRAPRRRQFMQLAKTSDSGEVTHGAHRKWLRRHGYLSSFSQPERVAASASP